jgi:hypothetical protein
VIRFTMAAVGRGDTHNVEAILMPSFESDADLSVSVETIAFSIVRHEEDRTVVESRSDIMDKPAFQRLVSGVIRANGHFVEDLTSLIDMGPERRAQMIETIQRYRASQTQRDMTY